MGYGLLVMRSAVGTAATICCIWAALWAFVAARLPAPMGVQPAAHSAFVHTVHKVHTVHAGSRAKHPAFHFSFDPACRPSPFGAVAALRSMSLRSIQLSALLPVAAP